MFEYLFILFCFQLSLIYGDPDMVIILTANEISSDLLTSNLEPVWTDSFTFTDFDAKRNFALGALLAEKYSLLLDNIRPDEVFVQASNHSFSQSSLSAQLMGIFQQENYQNLTQDKLFLPFQDSNLLNEVFSILQKYPLPNRLQLLKPQVMPNQEDILEINPQNCKFIFEEQYKRYFENQMMSEFNKTIQKLKNLGYEISHIHGLAELGAILYQRHLNREPGLEGIKYNTDLYQDAVFMFKWWMMYNAVGDSFERSLRLFPFYSNLERWLNEESFENTKLVLLSGYESLIYSLLDAYGVVNHEWLQAKKFNKTMRSNSSCVFPDSGSQIIFEVYKDQILEYPENLTIRALYNGNPIKICQNFECNIQEFSDQVSFLLNGMSKNIYEEACGVSRFVPTEISPPISVIPEINSKNNSRDIKKTEFSTKMSQDLKITHPSKDKVIIIKRTTMINCLVLAILLLGSTIGLFFGLILFGKLRYIQKYKQLNDNTIDETHEETHCRRNLHNNL